MDEMNLFDMNIPHLSLLLCMVGVHLLIGWELFSSLPLVIKFKKEKLDEKSLTFMTMFKTTSILPLLLSWLLVTISAISVDPYTSAIAALVFAVATTLILLIHALWARDKKYLVTAFISLVMYIPLYIVSYLTLAYSLDLYFIICTFCAMIFTIGMFGFMIMVIMFIIVLAIPLTIINLL